MNSSSAPEHRPVSYEDLRRFLLLVVSLVLLTFAVMALTKVLALFILVFFLALVLNPIVAMLERRGVRRGIGTVIVMIGLVCVLVGIGFLVVPPMMVQINEFAQQAPEYRERLQSQLLNLTERYPALESALPGGGSVADIDAAAAQLKELVEKYGPGLGGQLVAKTLGFLGGLLFSVLALLLTAFVLANPRPLLSGFLCAVPERHREATGRTVARMSDQMLAWARATLINGTITGISTGVLMAIIGVKPALVFGVLAFFGEFVPNLGPVVASVPALFVAAGMGTTKFLLALGAILFVQQVESNLLVPFIMGREMELHPITIIFFALGMGTVFGFAGAVLAVPTAALIKILFDEFYLKPNAVPVEDIERRANSLVLNREWPEPDNTMAS